MGETAKNRSDRGCLRKFADAARIETFLETQRLMRLREVCGRVCAAAK
jgi:hypothetical protein